MSDTEMPFNFEEFKGTFIKAAQALQLDCFDHLQQQGSAFKPFKIDGVDSLTMMDIVMQFEDLVEADSRVQGWDGFTMKDLEPNMTLGNIYELFCSRAKLTICYT